MLRIRAVFSAHRHAQSASNRGRTHTSLAFRVSGSSRFVCGDTEITADEASITMIPAGVDLTRYGNEEELIIVHMDMLLPSDEQPQIEVIKPRDALRYRQMFERLRTVWEERECGYTHICTALLYQILASLAKDAAIHPTEHLQMIDSGVSYLHRNFRNPYVRIGDAAAECHVSEVYFRKLYREIYHVSPLKAVNELRMQHACALLESGTFTVQQIAQDSGFTDVKYFRTAFRKRFGVTCTQYRAGLRVFPTI